MKVLLVGEFSRLHNSLKEGLTDLGHEVLLIGTGDLFKKYPVDINIDSSFFNKRIPLLFRKIILSISGFDIAQLEIYFRFKKALPKLKDFDVVQLINEDALAIHPKLQIPLLKQLFKQNKSSFLLSCGDDYININHYINEKERYSILTPYLNDKSVIKKYNYSLKYISKSYKMLHDFIYENIKGVIASDIDYHIPLKHHEAYLGLIANPINTKNIVFNPIKIEDKIHIFHGINSISSIRKGSTIIEEALKSLQQKYASKINIKTTHSLPYEEYIKVYDNAHIIMDQVYGYDQGYNALEAMAKGKVVFTGAEQEWLDYYHLEADTVAINALPDAEHIAKKLEWLILNPEHIETISKNARAFIEKEHDYITISKKYVAIWSSRS
ncbi:glycosyltransferase [Lacinutrix iliipiscaria]|uniref:Glycosyltransferase n=1 Tax=Lacinutrix iliipiscaria TaxID=1230532 RepID=A0ABW5WMZ7_9FLAO